VRVLWNALLDGEPSGRGELDLAFLFAGMLTAATYFDQDTADEAEVRRLADALYRRADGRQRRRDGDDGDARQQLPDHARSLPGR
jgi:hypothetical protein